MEPFLCPPFSEDLCGASGDGEATHEREEGKGREEREGEGGRSRGRTNGTVYIHIPIFYMH